MPDSLNRIERRILDFLVDSLKRNTYQPSIREIGKRFGIKSTKTVSEHLQSLADKGYIERDASRSRGVRLLGLELLPDTVRVPCYGEIAAGTPALLPEHLTGMLAIGRDMVHSVATFSLTVEGDSMVGEGIFDGDRVLVDPVTQAELEDGEIIAARIDGKATIKRYFLRGRVVVLEPANPEYPPITVDAVDDFAVLGRVTGLFRDFIGPRAAAAEA